MDSKTSSFLLFLVLFTVFSSTSMAFNITRLLSNYPEFSTFNRLLSQTGLAQQINSRQTITVLAVANRAIRDLSGKPLDVTKRVLGAHVILDYYDETKLSKLQEKSNILTTLYQTTGVAVDQQGFLNVTRTPKGIMFGPAAKGAPLTVSLKGVVASQPYNISVLKVSGVIEAPGIESKSTPPPEGSHKKAPLPAPTPAESPAPAADDDVATGAPTEAPTPAADGPESDGPVSSYAPESDGPISSYAPESDGPVSSPPEPDSPLAEGETQAEAPDQQSGSSLTNMSGAAAVTGLAACIMVF
ncbi:hypothetical protein JCGZ_07006 [Jatropha curcas]|uniref:FAS1 domain-containing protein n=1 Tax=Jatropha curcas TaxID=180498 RepID=A0A067KMB6_JATCU|nr:fasciclin-like arabinogalactan protein 3 [Jatropha curcas]KDP33435.1 hypothetical protein JCGZ_07006 [Jatropha curcas]